MSMKEIKIWTLPVERVLYNDLKKMSIDEGKALNDLCLPAIIAFRSELMKIRDSIIAVRKKQLEDAALAQVPLIVPGHQTDPLQYIPAF